MVIDDRELGQDAGVSVELVDASTRDRGDVETRSAMSWEDAGAAPVLVSTRDRGNVETSPD
eukprot:3955665-Heterocapsa_arctica.AAC.1